MLIVSYGVLITVKNDPEPCVCTILTAFQRGNC